jgi:alkylated DNA repair dioxygenase AlkB
MRQQNPKLFDAYLTLVRFSAKMNAETQGPIKGLASFFVSNFTEQSKRIATLTPTVVKTLSNIESSITGVPSMTTPLQAPQPTTQVQGINISTKSSDKLGRELTNPNWGANYIMDIEAEYKANASKIKAPQLSMEEALRFDMNLMYKLQMKKFANHPELVQEITNRGGVKFLEASEHTVGVKGSRWEGKGTDSNFIKVLIRSYQDSLKTTQPAAKFTGDMTYSYGNEKRPGVIADTTFDAILSGERTATTRFEKDGNLDYWKNAKIGDIITWRAKDGRTVDVEVTKALHPLVGSGKTPEMWSKLEGWSIGRFNTKVKPLISQAYQIEFKLAQPAIQQQVIPTQNVLSTFVNHSGGALGSDTKWDIVGKEFGMVNNRHYFTGVRSDKNAPLGNVDITNQPIAVEGATKVALAAKEMWGYNYSTMKDQRLIRNWAQVANSDAVFAIGTLGKKGDIWKGDENAANPRRLLKPAVQGGTGYAVEMAIQAGKPVYVFDQVRNEWFKNVNGQWSKSDVPILTPNFAGIGTREINEAGLQAIKAVYEKTLQELSTVKPKGTEVKAGIFVNEGAISKEQQLELFNYLKPFLEEQASKTNKGANASKMIGLGLRWDYKSNNPGKTAVNIPDVINPLNKTKYGYYTESINEQPLGQITNRFREIISRATGLDMSMYDGAIINLYDNNSFISSHNDVDESESAINYPVVGINLGGTGNFSIESRDGNPMQLKLDAGTAYVFGVNGVNREVFHRTFPTTQDSFLPELTTKLDNKTYEAGSYRVTITMRRVMPIEGVIKPGAAIEKEVIDNFEDDVDVADTTPKDTKSSLPPTKSGPASLDLKLDPNQPNDKGNLDDLGFEEDACEI